MRYRVAWGVAIALALSLTGCGGGNDDSETAPASTSSTIVPTAEPALTLASFNVLHGAFCTDDGGHCDAANRMALLTQHIAAACPDVVALQEVAPWIRDLLGAQLPTLCDGKYDEAFAPGDGLDGLLTLIDRARFGPPEASETRLSGGERAAQRITLAGSRGPIRIVNTHAGTGADDVGNGGRECAEDPAQCPAPCDPAGSMFACQILQLRDLAAGASTALIVGDLNLVASSPLLSTLTDAGYVDTYLAAGNAECDPATGTACTSGRADTSLDLLRDPNARNSVRVDYVFLRADAQCEVEYGPLTGLFAHEPATDGPGGLAWVSDHVGTAAELTCA